MTSDCSSSSSSSRSKSFCLRYACRGTQCFFLKAKKSIIFPCRCCRKNSSIKHSLKVSLRISICLWWWSKHCFLIWAVSWLAGGISSSFLGCFFTAVLTVGARGRLDSPCGTVAREGLVGGGGDVIPNALGPPTPAIKPPEVLSYPMGLLSCCPWSTCCCCCISCPWIILLIWGGKLVVVMWPGLVKDCIFAPLATGLWGPRWWMVPPDCEWGWESLRSRTVAGVPEDGSCTWAAAPWAICAIPGPSWYTKCPPFEGLKLICLTSTLASTKPLVGLWLHIPKPGPGVPARTFGSVCTGTGLGCVGLWDWTCCGSGDVTWIYDGDPCSNRLCCGLNWKLGDVGFGIGSGVSVICWFPEATGPTFCSVMFTFWPATGLLLIINCWIW